MGKIRKSRTRQIVFFWLSLALLWLNRPAHAQPAQRTHQPRFFSVPCRLELPPGEIRYLTVQCGYLQVPENRETGRGVVQLAVVRLLARSENPQPDPIVYLAGGPGGNASGRLDEWHTSPLREERDVFLFDQRGTGRSRPSLDCDGAFGNSVESWALRCLRILYRRGIDPRNYTSRDSAADLRDLRLALHIDEWNLVGVSYGSRLALTTLRDHPEGVRSVILDSVYPPPADFYGEQASNGAKALSTLFTGCAADPACAAAYPELERVMHQTMTDLNEQHSEITLTNPRSGEAEVSIFGGSQFYQSTFRALYSVDDIPYLPLAIYEMSVGNSAVYAQLISANRERGRSVNDGVYYSVQCSEEAPFTIPEDLARAAATVFPPSFQAHVMRGLRDSLKICEFWPVSPLDPVETEAVHSEIPALLLAGEYDPITPPAWAALAAETLPNSYSFTLRGIGHGVIRSSDCGTQIARNFLSAPTAHPSDECLATLSGPAFVIEDRWLPTAAEE
ncbi:MAG: alpha/beta hydrolase [Anaerolineaceae bacterium]|nr:alpha/beta hydrolase [Anaerolineaceae bacterium]